MSKLTAEDFEVWQSSAVTQALYRHVESAIKDCEYLWAGALDDASYGPQSLHDLRIQLNSRSTVLHQMRTLAHEDLSNERHTTNVTNIKHARS